MDVINAFSSNPKVICDHAVLTTTHNPQFPGDPTVAVATGAEFDDVKKGAQNAKDPYTLTSIKEFPEQPVSIFGVLFTDALREAYSEVFDSMLNDGFKRLEDDSSKLKLFKAKKGVFAQQPDIVAIKSFLNLWRAKCTEKVNVQNEGVVKAAGVEMLGMITEENTDNLAKKIMGQLKKGREDKILSLPGSLFKGGQITGSLVFTADSEQEYMRTGGNVGYLVLNRWLENNKTDVLVCCEGWIPPNVCRESERIHDIRDHKELMRASCTGSSATSRAGRRMRKELKRLSEIYADKGDIANVTVCDLPLDSTTLDKQPPTLVENIKYLYADIKEGDDVADKLAIFYDSDKVNIKNVEGASCSTAFGDASKNNKFDGFIYYFDIVPIDDSCNPLIAACVHGSSAGGNVSLKNIKTQIETHEKQVHMIMGDSNYTMSKSNDTQEKIDESFNSLSETHTVIRPDFKIQKDRVGNNMMLNNQVAKGTLDMTNKSAAEKDGMFIVIEKPVNAKGGGRRLRSRRSRRRGRRTQKRRSSLRKRSGRKRRSLRRRRGRRSRRM